MLLEQNLKRNYEIIAQDFGENFEWIVSDDNSSDGTTEFMADPQICQKMPRIKYVIHRGDRGFGNHCNFAVMQSTGKYLFFLNSDVELTPGAVKGLFDALSQREYFCVVPRIIRPEQGHMVESITTARLRIWGIEFDHQAAKRCNPEKDHDVLWGCGAAMMCRRAIFDEIGGFDQAYSPYYVEDADLSLKAWRRKGLVSRYIAGSIVFHAHQQSIQSQSQKKRDRISLRNQYIFLLKHFWNTRTWGYVFMVICFHVLLLHGKNLRAILSAMVRCRLYSSKFVANKRTGLDLMERVNKQFEA